MKAIILAAGKGTRLQPLTLGIPKAMVEVHGKPLLEYNMEQLVLYVNEFVLIVKYKQEIIREYFGNKFQGIPIRYHEQGEKLGTAGALEGLKLSGGCFILASDTLYKQSDIDILAKSKKYAVLCREVRNPEKYGTFDVGKKMKVNSVVEKSKIYHSNLASVFYFKLNSDMIEFAQQVSVSERGEYELTDALNMFVKKNPVFAIKLKNSFIDITSLQDLKDANSLEKPKLGKTQYLEDIGEYELHLGIPKNGIKEIVEYSLDKNDIALRLGTSDWKKRFISEKNLISWYNDNERYPFTLLTKKGKVVGLWWGRPAQAPHIECYLGENEREMLLKNTNNIHTSGIRIYPEARGKSIAPLLLEKTAKYYYLLYPEFCMSVDIYSENIPSIKSYEKNGYTKIGTGKNINNSPESGKERFIFIKKY